MPGLPPPMEIHQAVPAVSNSSELGSIVDGAAAGEPRKAQPESVAVEARIDNERDGSVSTEDVSAIQTQAVPSSDERHTLQPEGSLLADKIFSQSSSLDRPQDQASQGMGAASDDRWWEETSVLDIADPSAAQVSESVDKAPWATTEKFVVSPPELLSPDQTDDPSRPQEPQRDGPSETVPAVPAVPSQPQPAAAAPPELPVAASSPEAAPAQQPPATNQTYQIKHINWTDGRSSKLGQASILVQNINGPCPLVALVNALSLGVAPGSQSVLAEALLVREQIGLGLLLDAVLDELMTSRSGANAPTLPDVGDLYDFLKTLDTGMNVNPRFVPLPRAPVNLVDAPVEEGPPAAEDTVAVPGQFEETRGMQLYGTFCIPLVHGWLPRRDHPVYTALQRSAQTYEDAQNLLFREEELEEKLRRDGLSPEEQQMLQDVVIITHFLSQSATQLTTHGLEVLSEELAPGSLSILFRNDHFSTVYKHPSSHQLLQPVTDMGYAGHAEIVWESLVDVTGEGSEFFAGDFRLVGNNVPEAPSRARPGTQHVRSLLDDEPVWATAQDRRNQHRRKTSRRSNGSNPMRSIGERLETNLARPAHEPVGPRASHHSHSPVTEQEDHDLALALQLQEEEDDLARQDQAAQRPQPLFSESIGSPSRPRPLGLRSPGASRPLELRPSGAPRSAGPTRQEVRPLVPPLRTPAQWAAAAPVANSRGDDDLASTDGPPPSYEQAARVEPYYPPPDHPAHSSSPVTSQSSLPGLSAYPTTHHQHHHHASELPAQQPGSYPSMQSPSNSRRRYSRSGRDRYAPGGLGSARMYTPARMDSSASPSSTPSAGARPGAASEPKKECLVM